MRQRLSAARDPDRPPRRRALLGASLAAAAGAALAPVRALAQAVTAAGSASTPAAPKLALPPGDLSLARILETRRLVVAMGRFDAPPFFTTAGGRYQGQDVWFAQQLATALGVALEIRREMNSFNDVVDAVDRQQVDLAVSKVSITYPRALRVLFSEPYLVLRHALAFNRVALAHHLGNRDLASEVRRWSGEIGVIAKSSFVEFAQARFPDARLVEFENWEELVDAVLHGRVLCAYRDELEIKRIGVRLPSASLHLRTAVLSDTRDSIGMVFPRAATHLQQFANIFLQNQSEPLSANGLLNKYKPLLKSS